MEIDAASLVLSSFRDMFGDVLEHGHMNYWLKGGRGSTKSSFVSLCIVLLMMLNRSANAVIVRKVGNTLWDSVYQQMLWAVDMLGVGTYWAAKKAPLELTYLPTGQKVLFRGGDDPMKLKSTKFERGYCAITWFEELDQFDGMDEIRSILNSLRRGGETFWTFYSYNPPKTAWAWVNREALRMEAREDSYVHSSSYLDVAGEHPEWLGQPFIDEAEYVRGENERQYRWEYLGEVTGVEGTVFENLRKVTISDDEIAGYDNHRNGCDFGWFPDPWRFVRCEWQPSRRRLVIFDEHSANKTVPEKTGQVIRRALTYSDGDGKPPTFHNEPVWCDGADMTAIAIYRRQLGLNARPAAKGNMRKQSYLWLAGLREIAIDPARCPLTYEEFALCEYARDAHGEYVEDFSDGHDHSIDAVRYAMMREARAGR